MVKCNLEEVFEINPGEKILIIEDVLSTGGSIKEVSELINRYKGEIIGIGIIVDRSTAPVYLHDNFFAITKQTAKIFDKNNLPDHVKDLPAIKPGSNVVASDVVE